MKNTNRETTKKNKFAAMLRAMIEATAHPQTILK